MSPQLIDPVLLHTDFPDLQLHASGKVRDVYHLDGDRLLFVATDRISAFDYVLATGIPHKGRVLTQISLFWFDFLKDVVPNHLITADISQYPAELRKYEDQLRGPVDDRDARRDVPGRVRGARLHLRIGLEGIQSHGHGQRHPAARRPARVRPTSRADLHSCHQGDHRPRRKHFVRRDDPHPGRRS